MHPEVVFQPLQKQPPVDLVSFPFESILAGFKSSLDPVAFEPFVQYYFRQLKQRSNLDLFFGPLSPLLISIYHNNHPILKRILLNHFYPNVPDHFYIGPIEYAFRLNHITCIVNLCKFVVSEESGQVPLTYRDFTCLLSSNLPISHRTLANLFHPAHAAGLPELMYLRYPVKVKQTTSVQNLLGQIFLKNRRKERNNRKSLHGKKAKTKSKNKNKKQSLNPKKRYSFQDEQIDTEHMSINRQNARRIRAPAKFKNKPGPSSVFSSEIANRHFNLELKKSVVIKTIPFKVNFEAGSSDCLDFFNFYSFSSSSDFILSDWRYIVMDKWYVYKPYQIALTVLFFTFATLNTIHLVFLVTSNVFNILTIAVMSMLVLVESIQMLAFIINRPGRYFKSISNWLDWLIFIATIIITFIESNLSGDTAFIIITTFNLLLIYYRLFIYLKVFDSFTVFVGIINIIIVKLIPFFIILGLFFTSSAFMLMFLQKTTSPSKIFMDAYADFMFGAVSSTSFEPSHSFIPVIFGTVFIGIILLNILIAYLSNVFSRLEGEQRIDNLREKSNLILDFESIISIFRRMARGFNWRFKAKAELYHFTMSRISSVGGASPGKVRFLIFDVC